MADFRGPKNLHLDGPVEVHAKAHTDGGYVIEGLNAKDAKALADVLAEYGYEPVKG